MSRAVNIAGDPGESRRLWLLVFCLSVAAVLAIYVQTGSFGYVNYDDGIITRGNQQIERGLSAGSLKRIFTPAGMATYQPMRDLAVETVYEFSGVSPSGYHWFNLFLYLACLAALFWLLRIVLPLAGRQWPGGTNLWALLGTAWFAVHPVHVEAVAWMNGSKELLSGMFYFLALGFYINARQRGLLSVHYVAGLLCFILGLLSKPSVVAFPLVILALELLFPGDDRRIGPAVKRLVPYLAPTMLAAFYFALRTTAAMDQWLQESMLIHMLSMASVLGRYLINMAVPLNLSHSYPPPFFFGEYDWRLLFYLFLDFSIVAGIWLAVRRGARLVAFALLFFLLNLLPVSGLVPIAVFMADRYLFIPSLGLILAALVGLARLVRMRPGGMHHAVPGVAMAAMLLLLAVISYERCGQWKDSLTLWRSAVKTHGNFQFNHYGLGNAYLRLGMPHKAKEAYSNANRFADNIMCHYYLGRIEDSLGDSVAARRHFEQVERMFEPRMTGQMEEMAQVYRRLGKKDKLAGQLVSLAKKSHWEIKFGMDAAGELAGLGYGRQALELVDSLAAGSLPGGEIYLDAAVMFTEAKAYEAASSALLKARRTSTDNRKLALAAADLAFGRGEWEEAVSAYDEIGHSELGSDRLERLAAACLHSGRHVRALELFKELSASQGDKAPAQLNNTGVVLEAMDSLRAAARYFSRALELDSTYADAWYNNGRVRTALAEYEAAYDSYNRVMELEGPRTGTELAIARLLVKMGRYETAVAVYARVAKHEPHSSAVLLEAADMVWRFGNKTLAVEIYKQLKALPDSSSFPQRVRNRTAN